MNSYFASVEQQANPFLRGRAVGVCAYLNDYGCIIASSVEAKLRGVKTGCRVPEARRWCPNIVLVENDPKKYRGTTTKIFSILADYTDSIEPYSIDEAFLEFTDINTCHPGRDQDPIAMDSGQARMTSIAQEMKQRIKTEVGDWLQCSIGIAPTRWLAKVGSDFQKPDGLTIVTLENLPSIYDRMKLTDAWGIGDRLEARLNRLGIYTLNELRMYPVANIMEVMGLRGYELWANVNAIEYQSNATNDDANATNTQPKSIGHSYCLPRAVQDPGHARGVLMKLCEKTARRLRDDGREAWSLSCAWGYASGGGDSVQRRVESPLWSTEDIFTTAQELIQSKTHYLSLSKALRLGSGNNDFRVINFLAVSVSDLRPPTQQLSLWNNPHTQQQQQIVKAMDAINNRYGEYTLTRGSMWGMQEFARDRIGFRKSVSAERSTREP